MLSSVVSCVDAAALSGAHGALWSGLPELVGQSVGQWPRRREGLASRRLDPGLPFASKPVCRGWPHPPRNSSAQSARPPSRRSRREGRSSRRGAGAGLLLVLITYLYDLRYLPLPSGFGGSGEEHEVHYVLAVLDTRAQVVTPGVPIANSDATARYLPFFLICRENPPWNEV